MQQLEKSSWNLKKRKSSFKDIINLNILVKQERHDQEEVCGEKSIQNMQEGGVCR